MRSCERTLPLMGSLEVRAAKALAPAMVLAGRFELRRELGQGGVARVFAAYDRAARTTVALKTLREDCARDRGWARRLTREFLVARRIVHPNVCRTYELGFDADRLFITMELASRGTLRGALDGPLRWRRANICGDAQWSTRLAVARAICSGVAALHDAGVTHGDLTPRNILRARAGRWFVSDFGLALPTGESTTFFGGTPRYMPPELVYGLRSGCRGDVWQLGVVLHELLLGGHPRWSVRAGRPCLQTPIGNSKPSRRHVMAIVARCLDQDPARRPADATVVSDLLSSFRCAERSI
jgi:serine/threonine-protein kinase